MISRYRVSSSLRFHEFVRSVCLLAAILGCVVVHGENDVNVSTLKGNILRQKDVASSTLTQSKARELSTIATSSRRHVPDSSVFPYSAVGLLRWNVSTCTATLVASNIVLTAAECILDSNGKVRDSSPSSSGFTLSQAADSITASVHRVHKQTDYWKKETRNSYVLIELDAKLGDVNGVLLLPPANTFAQDNSMSVQLVGYGCNDESGECFQRCDIRFPSESNDPDYLLHHNCDVSAKRSLGSPMLIRSTQMDTYIVGMSASSISDTADDDITTESHDGASNQGVLGSFIQPHLSSLVRQAESSTSSSSLESSSTSSSSNLSSDDEAHDKSSNRGQENQVEGGPSAAVDSSSASTSSTETSVTSSQNGIAPTAAYTCIGLVCTAWLVIIVAVIRRIRANHR